MNRALFAIAIVALSGAFLLSQDKPPAPAAAPAENYKIIALFKGEAIQARDGVFYKSMGFDTLGYNEARVSIYIRPPRGKTFGKGAKQELVYYNSHTHFACGAEIGKKTEMIPQLPQFTDTAAIKVFGKSMSVMMTLKDLELDEVNISVEVLLIK